MERERERLLLLLLFLFSAFRMETDAETGQKKEKSWSLLQVIRDNATEFCQSTSLHGLQYVGDNQRPFFERFVHLPTFCTVI